MAATEEKKQEPRMAWVQMNVEPVYRHMRTEVFKKNYMVEKTQAAIRNFLNKAECRVLCIFGDRCTATHTAPKQLRGREKGVYFLKLRPFVVKQQNIDQILFGEMAKDPLSHLKTMLQEVYVPLLVNPRNHAGWGEVVSKEVMDKVYNLLASVTITVGQMEGQTTLPLPPMDANTTGSNKERIYLLESAVITWTKQIRHVLKQDPELLLKQGFDPTPNMEIAFWQNKASNLNSIFKQLQGAQVRRVLKFLDQSKSTYCSPFAKLCKDVFQARLEANDNVRYLQTLKKWFDNLSDSTASFPTLIRLFKPILHTILLIWKHSEHYNSAPRLVVLMREICNALINQARQYISGRSILDMIEAEETGRAVEQLRTTLKVCSTFKSTYFDYKAKSSVECPNDAWRIQNTALFFRLDSFLERCHDILELCSTIVQFSKLQRIEIGGTKGKTLTTSVRQVYNDFSTAVSAFQDVPYDIMDIRARRFDDDFYEFRCKIKELERRLGSAITQAFDDSATIYGQFKLLDSFDGLLERPIIHDELEKKHSSLIRAYGEDLAIVGDIFLRERALFEEAVDKDGEGGAANVVGRNMPPIAGALGWCSALMDRIREPMEKLLKLSKNNRILDEDEGKEVVKIFKGTMGKLEEFEHERIKLLGQDVQTTSLNKLKNHIIIRDAKSKLLSVNFDPSLVRLLREVKYFKLAELEVPEAAASIYKKVETYRQYTGNLDMIVSAYNRVLTSMLPVEAPLLAHNIEMIDKTLKMGIEVMNWKSHGIEIFLIEGISKVKKCSDTLDKMKDNVSEIRKFLEHWCRQPLLSRKNKPVSIEIYEQDMKPGITSRYDEIKKGGVAIHKLLMDVNKTLKVSKGLPDWKNFVDFCNEIVVDGLVQLVVQSLNWLSDILDPNNESVSTLPMLEIKVDLVGKEVQFSPEIYSTADGSGVRDVVNKWIDSFVNVGTLFRRLDKGSHAGSGNEEYVKDLIENLEVVCCIARINSSLSNWESKCNQYRDKFSRYSYLWSSDMNEAMATFTEEAYDEKDGAKFPKLELFDKKLTDFRKERETVDTLYAFEDIGWLRVNAHSIKQALNMWITKWTMAFVGNLSNHVLSTLNNLDEFMATVREGLQSDIPDGDEDQLKVVMAHIRDVRRRMDATGAMWEPLHECIALLKKHKYPVDDMVVANDVPVQDYLESAPITWDSTVNLTFLKKEEIFPLQNAAAEELKDTIAAFYARLKEFRTDFKQHAPFHFSGQPELAYKSLDQFHERLVSLESELVNLRNMEDLFELNKTVYHETKDTLYELKLLKRIWDFKAFVELTFADWRNLKWLDIDTDELEIQTETIKKRMKAMGNEDKLVQAWSVFKDIKKLVTNMAMVLPLVNQLHSPSMRERHWKGVAKVCEVDKLDHGSPTFCLDDLLKLRLHLYLEPVQDIVETAAKELKIETKLNKIEAIWAGLALEYINFKDKEIKIVRVPDEVVEFLEAHTAELQTIVGMGKFVDYFRTIVNKWQSDLGQVEVVLLNWQKVTKQWSSLEAIFLQSEDIRRELPKVTKMFEDVDAKFKDMCAESSTITNVVDACCREGFEEILKTFFVPKLETCQKSLNEYLDMKKKIFPRFYFISNVALLEILSNGNMPRRIMQQISGCFINLKTLQFVDKAGKLIAGMESNDKESVPFPKDLELQGQVEYWLNDLLVAMRQALQYITNNANASAVGWDVASEMPRHEWQYKYPAQVVLTCASIQWTDETEQALGDAEAGNEDAVKGYENKCTARLFNLIDLVRGKLTSSARTKIITMITMDVHSRDVVHKLAVSRAVSVDCFMWQQQLRFYYHAEDRETDIKICDFFTKYSNEYIGNTGRLVITPLTDRCYITLTMALRLMLGGAPAGPAGTGKTETTKDLARALALPIYVFNCSDQMNFMTLADIFKGLSQAGAWGCFDEFNRIPIEVLSVVATQVKSVLDAIVQLSVPANRPKEYQDKPPGQPPCVVGKFVLNGDEITLVPTTGFFITMNPGYAGRTELPENLKALFRSCAMIRPDLAPICENMLMAEGFKDARPLSVKFVTLYELSSELLSPQCHYDWGLRSVKSVLRVAGLLKRQSPNMKEEKVLMRALRDFNTPKMPNSDIPIFLRLIQDLFPESYKTEPMKDQSLIKICKKVAKDTDLQPDEGFVGKVVEFQELLDVRHSVMLIGPAGSGKTTIIKTLLRCWNNGYRQNGKVHSKPIGVSRWVNPKSVTTNELYGYMTLSKEWKDGILSIIMRGMSKNFKELGFNEYQQAKWVCLDGDVDAVWIESMNTVMDSNKVLTLVSNERVPLDDAMRMVFEINSLANATPATVSRAGILYINEEDIGWQPFVDSWVHQYDKNVQIQSTLPRLFHEFVDQILKTTMKGLKTIVPIRCINQVQTLCYLLQSLIEETEVELTAPILENLFAFSCIWAFGGGLVHEDKPKFSERFLDIFKKYKPFQDKSQKELTVFDFSYSPLQGRPEGAPPPPDGAKRPSEFTVWDKMREAYMPQPLGNGPEDEEFSQVFIQTADTVSRCRIVKLLTSHGRPALLVGNAGTGKTCIIKHFIARELLADEMLMSSTININFYMDAKMLQTQIEGNLDKRPGSTFGPPGGKRLLLFVDDLNLPYIEEYGTQNSLSLFRQLLGHGGMYDREDLGLYKTIVDVLYLASMNPTAGSFTINERVQIQFTTISCSMPEGGVLQAVYGALLDGHFALNNFSDGMKEMSESLVQASIFLHQQVARKFMPSASKFVYTWNMRELSNLFRGMLLSNPAHFQKPGSFVDLWLHESNRVFADRLVTETDYVRFQEIIGDCAKKHFINFMDDDDNDDIVDSSELPIFTAFHNSADYEKVNDREKLKEFIMHELSEYNESNAIMNLELFQQALEHCTRIVRIIQNRGGSAMLVGVGGSGKQSLSRLASHICEYPVVTIPVTSGYGVNDFLENLKEYFITAGVKNQSFVFLMADKHVINERFLVYVNDILSSGYVADLFPRDELDGIFSQNRRDAKANGILDTAEANLAFFVERVKANLHVVMCFSPVGDVFRNRARRFPALVNCTAIDWFHPWSREALVSVAARFLKDVEIAAEVKENITHHMAEVHLSVIKEADLYRTQTRRNVYATPKSFLELIDFFKKLLAEKRLDLNKQVNRLGTGLATLEKTAVDVAELQEDLKVTMVKVEEKQKATQELLTKMGVQKAETQEQQAKAAVEQEKANKAASDADAIQTQASTELAAAEPMLAAAVAALDCLTKASLTELKAFNKLPGGVELVTKCVLMMLEGEFKNHKWPRAKKMMAKIDHFLNRLKAYRHEDMEEKLITKLTPVVTREDFTFENMKSKSQAAANLLLWVANVYKCNRIYVNVKPLMAKLEQANKDQQAAEQKLQVVNKLVAQVEAQFQLLENSFIQATNDKAKVEAQAKSCKERLDLANRLINGLGSEKDRWGKEIEQLKLRESNLTGDVLLAAGFVSYVGGFDNSRRVKLWKNVWIEDMDQREIALSEGADPFNMLVNDSEIGRMRSEGLPADRISLENGAIVNNCSRWPLLIDPQLQGIKWLRQAFAGDNLLVMQTNNKRWQNTLMEAISNGLVVIIENLSEEVDSAIEPVLARAVVKKGSGYLLKVGSETIDYNLNFKLVLQTRLDNPTYLPETQAQVTMINFIATEKGLEDQLLARVVMHEAAELEQRKQKLQQQFNQYQIQLYELEEQLLERLANAPEDILSDLPLIEGLEKTKATSLEVKAAVALGKETEIQINKSRELYRPIANEGAMLYFILTSLGAVEHMYQYSLGAFVSFFEKSMDKAIAMDDKKEKGPALTERVDNLQESLRLTVYTWVCRGLFEKDKMVLLTQIVFSLMRRGKLDVEFEMEMLPFLIRGPQAAVTDSPIPWLPGINWAAVQVLSEFPTYMKLPQDIEDAPSRFQEWFNHVSPETEKLPLDWAALEKKPFFKLMVLRCLRPDRMTVAISDFVRTALPGGSNYVDCDLTLNSLEVLTESYEDSSKDVPIYFILSPGTDVVSDLDSLAVTLKYIRGETYHNVSMGQGQDIIAERLLVEAAKSGHWVILNNVHLMPRWLKKLEKILDDYMNAGDSTHKDFRLFLTSDPSKGIPTGILNRAIKLTNEPPTGLKANLKRAFCTFSKPTFDELGAKVRAILFGLCHFHSLMTERKKFGPMGFNMMYPFSLGDLRDSAVCLNNYMEKNDSSIPWEDLRYIFGQIMYGGHIVNDLDRVLCLCYLDFIMDDGLLDEMELFPFNEGGKETFKCPAPTTYTRYLEYIEEEMKEETPVAYGLHPNAQIDFRTLQSKQFFNSVGALTPAETHDDDDEGGGGSGPQHLAENMLNDIMERIEDVNFDLAEVVSMLNEEKTPFQNVFLQEISQMSDLVVEMVASLKELALGFAGELTISDAMDALMMSLFYGTVPTKWTKLAWPSLRSLTAWMTDLQMRIDQLEGWVQNPIEIPLVTWLSGLINPQSFLTAIMQQSAQLNSWELDKLYIQTDVTKKRAEEVDARTRDGAFVSGLALEGARWNTNQGMLENSKPREMYFDMPVVYCKSNFAASRPSTGIYSCPVYKTRQRGPTYVFSAQLKTKSKTAKWVLGGVALVMDVSD